MRTVPITCVTGAEWLDQKDLAHLRLEQTLTP
jgi:hypothetical protein